ncbi:MAG: hypothetical protein IJ672_01420 [Methanobrevibacter sp.]|nr:hypothetical protein [Methanobrevibacter sp.]
MPKESFSEYFNKQKRKFNQEERINEAIRIMEERGYTVLTEGKLVKFLAGLALSLGLLTNANAREFNAQASSGYTSQKANTSMFAKDMQKNYNLQSDVQLTDKMVQTIVDNVAKKISQRMLEEDKYEEDELFALQEWQDAVTFYKSLVKADESLGNMFSRRLDKALTQSIRIAPNIQRYVIKNG